MDIDQLPVGRIAELVEYCTSVIEVRVWVPIQTSIIRKGIAYCSSGELVPLIHSEQLNFRPAITTVLWKWDTIKTVIIHNMIIVLITVIGSCVMITKHTNTIIRVASFHWLLCLSSFLAAKPCSLLFSVEKHLMHRLFIEMQFSLELLPLVYLFFVLWLGEKPLF